MSLPPGETQAAAPEPVAAHHFADGSAGAHASALFVGVPMHVLAVVMLLGVVLNFTNVIARYLFDAPLFWAEEVLVFSMIWAVFLALPAVTFNDEHLRMDLLYLQLRGWQRSLVNALCVLLYVGVGGFAAFHSYKVVVLLAATGQKSVAAALPMALVHAAIPLGLLLMVAAVVVRVSLHMARRGAHAGEERRS